LNDFSISGWIYLDQNSNTSTYPTFIAEENNYITLQYEIWPSGALPKFNMYFLNNYNVAGQQVEDGHVQSQSNFNQWHFFVLKNKNNINSLYIDGILKANSITPSSIQGQGNGTFLRFGKAQENTNDVKFIGKMDDIGIWNRALDSSEISNLYNGNVCYQYITVTDTLIINTNLTGFNPVNYENTIKIWPNPTNDHITIDYGNYANLSGYQLKINNSVGQQMFQTNIVQQTSYVDLGTWTGNGIYFVHLIDSQGNTVDIRKIVLQ
jgi:hypothetical protein